MPAVVVNRMSSPFRYAVRCLVRSSQCPAATAAASSQSAVGIELPTDV